MFFVLGGQDFLAASSPLDFSLASFTTIALALVLTMASGMATGLDSGTTRAGMDIFRRDTGTILAEIILILPVVSRTI